ncbi:MAG TPA: glutamyl-tRNA reductase [Candidatus Baltobacteraceae bacterium]|jgi:glutamyl-tRNA reductase|nr:glutamyl-tRNA reductase [Candidatus Baltobacteraceae bacterium]
MTLFAAGVSYKTTPIALREQLAVKPSQLVDKAHHLKLCGELDEIVLLSTCNRVEIYAVTRQLKGLGDRLLRILSDDQLDSDLDVYLYENAEAARHLFRVAGGLDSMVLGETEITGQVKCAYDAARAAQLTGCVLNRTFQSAFHTAKVIRTHTCIGRGATSVGSAAVELVEKFFGSDLTTRKVMIIGAGQTGETCARNFAKRGAGSILVCNRSLERAIELAAKVGARALPLDNCHQELAEVDIVVASTGCPNTLLHGTDLETLSGKRRNHRLLLIDISVPRNIDADVQLLNGVYLYNIDDLEAIVRENVRSRENDLAKCEEIIVSHVATLMAKLDLGRLRLNDAASENWTRRSIDMSFFNQSVPDPCLG